MMSPEKVAAEYGGNKQKIAQAVQMGLIQPTVAVMAGMFIDRMRGAAVQEQAPQSTVAQDTFAPPVQMAQAGLGATPQAQAVPQMPTQMAAAPAQTATLAEGGLTALPVDDDMFPDEYAGGGIIAFQGGGDIDYRLLSKLTDPEREVYYTTGNIPSRLMAPTTLGDRNLRDVPLYEDIFLGGTTPGMTSTDMLLGRYETTPLPKPKPLALNPEARSVVPAPKAEEAVTPKGKATETKAPEGVNIKAADKALTDYAKKIKEFNKEFGVSDEPDAKARAALDKYKEKLNKDLDKAGALGLIQAGLGIAGGKSQYALSNLQGAIPAIEQYGKAMSQIREGGKGILDSELKLDQAADARARGNVKLALELEQQAKELAIKERQAIASERQANKPSQFAESMAAYKADPKFFETYRKALGASDESAEIAKRKAVTDEFNKLYGTQFMILSNSKKPEDREAAKKLLDEFYASRGIGASTSTTGSIPADIAAIANKYK